MSQLESNRPTIWSYNGVELELDMTDPDVVERYEETFRKMDEEVKNGPKTGQKSEIIRHYCKMLRNVFERIFGEGTSYKLVVKDSAFDLTECYESFLAFVTAQNQALTDAQNRITNRYSPNRAQRRASVKN